MSFGSVQVEVSTRCQLNCLMCPKRCFSDEWVSKDMDMATFKIIPFRKFRYAHLQGWGEPLLNPHIDEMIEFAARQCKVGLTTNGVLISHHLDSILELDLLAVSVASADKSCQFSLRHFSLDRLREGIKGVSECRSGKKPRIVVATIMLRNVIEKLPKLVEFAAECGADEVVANNLDYIPSEELVGMEVFGLGAEETEKFIEMAKNEAEALGIKFVARGRVLEEALVCAENPVESCVVTVDGKIAPCVYLHLPTNSGKIVRFFKGRRVNVEKVYFNNLKEWERSSFRQIFRERFRVVYESIPLSFPELPEVCKTCYKAWSV